VRFKNSGLFAGIVAGLVLFSMAAANAVPSISVADAVNICQVGFSPPGGQAESSARRNACVALIGGIVGTMAQIAAMAEISRIGTAGSSTPGHVGLFCIHGDESYERLSDVFIRFAQANPQHKDRAAASIFVAAFAAAYPCSRD
jgi:hypothetical protein